MRRGRPKLHFAPRRVAVLGLAVLAAVVAAPDAARCQDRAPLEQRVKAAFLYKFTGYVEWPTEAFRGPQAPLVIGISGDRAIADALRRLLAGQTAGMRPIQVRVVDDTASIDGLHMIYVPRSRRPMLDELNAIQPRSLLVVTDMPDGLDHGGMINFNLVDGRVRFEISVPAAERARLTLSSRLLSVAQLVITQAH